MGLDKLPYSVTPELLQLLTPVKSIAQRPQRGNLVKRFLVDTVAGYYQPVPPGQSHSPSTICGCLGFVELAAGAF
jgi:hypothetical protein